MTDLDASRSVVAYQGTYVRIVLVGVGGTGSCAAFSLAQLVRRFNRRWNRAIHPRTASLFLVDYDLVEAKNVDARQQFYPFEIGAPKAQVLANRYGIGLYLRKEEIHAVVAPFSPTLLPLTDRETLIILVGCVDNAEARQSLARCLENQPTPSPIWWIDAGNETDFGQIYCGNTASVADLIGSLAHNPCLALPSPALLAPALVEVPHAPPETVSRTFACGDIREEGEQQSDSINLHMTGMVVHYVQQLLTGGIHAFATYTNLNQDGLIETRSERISALNVARAMGYTDPVVFALTLAGIDTSVHQSQE